MQVARLEDCANLLDEADLIVSAEGYRIERFRCLTGTAILSCWQEVYRSSTSAVVCFSRTGRRLSGCSGAGSAPAIVRRDYWGASHLLTDSKTVCGSTSMESAPLSAMSANSQNLKLSNPPLPNPRSAIRGLV
jgi:hypothetical protein